MRRVGPVAEGVFVVRLIGYGDQIACGVVRVLDRVAVGIGDLGDAALYGIYPRMSPAP